jgi:hypothetical protein
MKRVLIFTDNEAVKIQQQATDKKANAKTEIINYLNEFNINAPGELTLENCINEFNTRHNDFNDFIPTEKRMELIGLSLSKLQSLISYHNSIETDENDYNVYAETEQELKRLNIANTLLKSIAEFQKEQINSNPIPYGMLVNALGCLSWNAQKHELTFKHTWIKGNEY